MASPLRQQIENAATLIAALTPRSDATSAFMRVGDDLQLEGEPPYRRRMFDVRAVADGSITQVQFGTAYRQALARFDVLIRHDTQGDRDDAAAILAEDVDQVIGAMEASSARVNANVQQVRHVSGRIDEGESHHTSTITLTFECLYIVAT